MEGDLRTSGPGLEEFEAFCASALPDVYGYLLPRCRDRAIAEDLTSETFLAAVDARKRATVEEITVGWLIVVARRRLVDHWRRQEREDRRYPLVDPVDVRSGPDGFDDSFDVAAGLQALGRLGPHHQAVLTLRYLDGLPVAAVACELGRGLHATEALLQRARRALRRAYEEVQSHA